MMHSGPMQNDDDVEIRRNITLRRVRILSTMLTACQTKNVRK